MKKPIGYISYTHGLDGKVKIVPMVSKNDFENYIKHNEIKIDDANQTTIRLDIFAFTGKVFLCNVKGVVDIDQAKKITKHEIFVEVDKGDEYINPELLLQYDVFLITQKKKKYGKVIDFGDYGAGNLIEVQTLKGKSEFYLCNKNYILEVDDDKKSIFVKPND